MSEVTFTKLSCGCEWSPVAGLNRPDEVTCDFDIDKHMEEIKLLAAKEVAKDKK